MTNGKILLLGTNLGDREKNLSNARELLGKRVGEITKKSSIYETAPWGKTDQPTFLNQVVIVQTDLEPLSLLETINKIEKDIGRVRMEKWGERLIDVDILYYDDLVLNHPNLTIPHSEIANRMFTLMPLTEVAGELIDPIHHKPVRQLTEECKDELIVEIY